MIIIYGGTEEMIEKQKRCNHDTHWYGPCIDGISRYYKCLSCYCLKRDCRDEKHYLEALKEEEKYQKQRIIINGNSVHS